MHSASVQTKLRAERGLHRRHAPLRPRSAGIKFIVESGGAPGVRLRQSPSFF